MIGRIPCMNAVRLHGFIEGVKMRPCALHHVFVSDLLLDEENGRMDRWTGGFRKSLWRSSGRNYVEIGCCPVHLSTRMIDSVTRLS